MIDILNVIDELHESLLEKDYYNNEYEYYDSYYEDIIRAIHFEGFDYTLISKEEQLRAILQDKKISIELFYELLKRDWNNILNLKIIPTSKPPLFDQYGNELPEIFGNSLEHTITYILDSIWYLNDGYTMVRSILEELLLNENINKENLYKIYNKHIDLFYKYGTKINFNSVSLEDFIIDSDQYTILKLLNEIFISDINLLNNLLWNNKNLDYDLQFQINPHYVVRNLIIDLYKNKNELIEYNDLILYLVNSLKNNFNIYINRKDKFNNNVPYVFKKILKSMILDNNINETLELINLFKILGFNFDYKLKKYKMNLLTYLIHYTDSKLFFKNKEIWVKIIEYSLEHNTQFNHYDYKIMKLFNSKYNIKNSELTKELKFMKKNIIHKSNIYESKRILKKKKEIIS